MAEPVSSSRNQPLMSVPPEPEPNMSVNPGAHAVTPPVSPAASSPSATASSSPPSAPPALPGGAQSLVTKYGNLSGNGYLGLAAGAGPGNLGGRVSVAEVEGSWTGTSGETTTVSARAGTVEVDVGTKNVDGSTGAHLKVGAAVVTGELTTKGGAQQLSIGGDLGGGLEASSGTRDIDGDGNREYCIRGGAALVLGGCIEPGQLITDLETAWQTVKHLSTSGSYPGGRW
jgi:hypothetical protein